MNKQQAILVVDGKPVAHADDRRTLYEYMIESYGPFSEPTGYSMFWGEGDIDSADKLAECFDCHAGMDQTSFDLLDSNGVLFDSYILIDTWYLYEVYDEREHEAILKYCEENDIELNC